MRAERAHAARRSEVVADVGRPEAGPPGTRFTVTLDADPYSEEGYAAVATLLRLAGDGSAKSGRGRTGTRKAAGTRKATTPS